LSILNKFAADPKTQTNTHPSPRRSPFLSISSKSFVYFEQNHFFFCKIEKFLGKNYAVSKTNRIFVPKMRACLKAETWKRVETNPLDKPFKFIKYEKNVTIIGTVRRKPAQC
jgi:hypothetical protein